MQLAPRNVTLGLGLALITLTAACSGGLGSPTGPSFSGGPTTTGNATITGRTASMGSTASVGSLASPTTIRVCVGGTSTCTDIDGAGNFSLTGNFSGDVRLEFVGPQGTTSLIVPDVQPGETVVVAIELNGSTGVIRVESRGRSDDDDSEDSADSESEDDESEDDDSEDSEDSDSEDDESEDDDSEDSEDDDSEDDDSDDDSEDDDA